MDPYQGLELVTKDDEAHGPRYIQMDVFNTKDWLSFLEKIIFKESQQDKNTGGLVLLIDCAFQLGSVSIPNSFLNSVYSKLTPKSGLNQQQPLSSEQVSLFFSRRLVLWNDVTSLDQLNNKLGAISNSLSFEYMDRSLDYVIISNVSAFYWQMRDSGDFRDLVKFHSICKGLSHDYECMTISSMSYIAR